MNTNKPGLRPAIRYSEAFKMKVVRELETSGLAFGDVSLKYGITGAGTVQNWVRQYGNGTRGKVIRVEQPGEINELKRLKARCVSWKVHWPMRTSTRPWNGRTRGWPVNGRGSRTWRGSKKSRWAAGHEAIALAGDGFGVTVSGVCRKVGISRQNYYARRKARAP